MAGVNKVIIVGNLGADPEMRTFGNGDAVANLRVATSENWTDKNTGERKELTEWHRIVFYRKQAEICGQYLRKGSKVYVEGKLRTRKWTDQNGVERYTTEIQGDVLQMLDSRNQQSDNFAAGYPNPVGGNFNNGGAGYSQGSSGYEINQTSELNRAPKTSPVPSYPKTDDIMDDDVPF